MKTQFVEVTPKLAEEWLVLNKLNRSVSPKRVSAYKQAMERGEWMPTAEPIQFDTKGNLIDGQHRLLAIVASKKKQQIMVARDVDPKTIAILDTGKKRSAADYVHIKLGGKYADHVVKVATTAARLNYMYENGMVINYREAINYNQIFKHLQKNKHLLFCAQHMHEVRKTDGPFLGSGPLAFVMSQAYKKHPEEALTFFSRVASGLELRADAPETIARTLITKIHVESTRSYFKGMGVVILAWNKFLAGDEKCRVKELVWDNKQYLPEIN